MTIHISQELRRQMLTGTSNATTGIPISEYVKDMKATEGTLLFNEIVFDLEEIRLYHKYAHVATIPIPHNQPGDTLHLHLTEGVMAMRILE